MTAPDRSVDASRPFGAHIALRWWDPILLTLLVVGATYILQFLFLAAAAIVEVGLWGEDPNDPTLTPLSYLATNVAIILMAPLMLLALRVTSRPPWRSAMAPGRRFSWR